MPFPLSEQLPEPLGKNSIPPVGHHVITELAEHGEAGLTIISIAWLISRRMLEPYSHIRMEAKRRALKDLETPATRDTGPDACPILPHNPANQGAMTWT